MLRILCANATGMSEIGFQINYRKPQKNLDVFADDAYKEQEPGYFTLERREIMDEKGNKKPVLMK